MQSINDPYWCLLVRIWAPYILLVGYYITDETDGILQTPVARVPSTDCKVSTVPIFFIEFPVIMLVETSDVLTIVIYNQLKTFCPDLLTGGCEILVLSHNSAGNVTIAERRAYRDLRFVDDSLDVGYAPV